LLRARQKIDKYRILGRIATGPLADVYRAYDTIQKIKVALKIPKQDEHTGHDELLHEVRVATKLKHPNILSVLNASYIDDQFVIAMELGEESLADRIERRTSTASKLDTVSGQPTETGRLWFCQTRLADAESIGLGDNRLHRARASDGPAEVPVRRVFDGPRPVSPVLGNAA
jgi:serine/threonine protein kinase